MKLRASNRVASIKEDLNNEENTDNATDSFKLPPITGSRQSIGSTNNYFNDRDKLNLAKLIA